WRRTPAAETVRTERDLHYPMVHVRAVTRVPLGDCDEVVCGRETERLADRVAPGGWLPTGGTCGGGHGVPPEGVGRALGTLNWCKPVRNRWVYRAQIRSSCGSRSAGTASAKAAVAPEGVACWAWSRAPRRSRGRSCTVTNPATAGEAWGVVARRVMAVPGLVSSESKARDRRVRASLVLTRPHRGQVTTVRSAPATGV